jgi:hypothetical protein
MIKTTECEAFRMHRTRTLCIQNTKMRNSSVPLYTTQSNEEFDEKQQCSSKQWEYC